MADELKNFQDGDRGNPYASGAGQIGYEMHKQRQERESGRNVTNGGGGSTIDGPSVLVLILLVIAGLIWWDWDNFIGGIKADLNTLAEVIQQNWFWILSYPVGVTMLLVGFSLRSKAWKKPKKMVAEIIFFAGGFLIFFGYRASGYETENAVIFWISPLAWAFIAISILYISIFIMDQPHKFQTEQRIISLIGNVMAAPFLAAFLSVILTIIVVLIADHGFGYVEKESIEDSRAIVIALGLSWPLSFYWASKQGYIRS